MTLKPMPSALLVAVCAVLFGCDNKKAETTTATDKTADTTTATTNAPAADTATGDLADTQEIVINNGAEPQSLDPHKVSGVPESNILRQMFVGLVSTDQDGKTIPGMATEWSSPDNKVWTFKLRDAKWSNGDPVTAHDFVYSLQRLTDPATGSPYGTYLADAKVVGALAISEGKAKPDALGVKAIDDKTLEITLEEPVPYFADLLVLPVTYAVNKKAIDAHGDKWTEPSNYIANGAYKLKDWVVNSHITIERNKDYFDDANTKIQEANFLPIESAATAVNRYKAGEVDVTGVPPEQVDLLKKEMGSEIHTSPKLCSFYYELNNEKAPFNNPNIRRAISLAIDRDTLAKVTKRGEQPTYQFTPPAINGMGDVSPEWSKWDLSKRAEEGKKLLTEAGYSAQNPLKFEILYSTSEMGKLINAAVASMLKEQLGGLVDASIINQEWKTSLDTRRQGKYEAAMGGWCSDYNEPSTFLNIMRSNNGNNTGKYKNPEFDRLIDGTLKPGLTQADRIKMYHEAEAILDKDAAIAPLYNAVSMRIVKPYLQADSLADPSSSFQIKDWELK